jgi:uncharacterized glyoxalase superfamily protein PhnB
MFRLELFVKNLHTSRYFYENVLGFPVESSRENAVLLRYGSFQLLITDESILSDNHYFKKLGASEKGKGVELILMPNDVERLYNHILKLNYPIETPLGQRDWGMTDFRLVDPDGYYWRVTTK